jgi:tRNA-dihydrouridine synthase
MKIGSLQLPSPFVVAPMAGMTDSAFRRLVKRHGGCGLVVTEMVSSEGLVRGIDRTLEYAEYTEEERPVSIQIFGGDPAKMAAAAQVVEGLGADIVDVNMGCPVPKSRNTTRAAASCGNRNMRPRDRRNGEGRQDSGDGQNARRMERQPPQRARSGADVSRTPAQPP